MIFKAPICKPKANARDKGIEVRMINVSIARYLSTSPSNRFCERKLAIWAEIGRLTAQKRDGMWWKLLFLGL